jgi:hypothetical protein
VFRNTEFFFSLRLHQICILFFFSKISPLYFYNLQTNIVMFLSYSFLFVPLFLSSSAILVYDIKVYSSTVLKQSCNKKSFCSNISRKEQDAEEDNLSTAPRVVIWDFQERMAIASLRNTWLLRVSEVRGFFIKCFYFQNCKVRIIPF